MSKRQSVSSGHSVTPSNEIPMSFEQYLSMAQEKETSKESPQDAQNVASNSNPTTNPPQSSKKPKVSSKYGIHVAKGMPKSFIELNKQKLEKRQDQVQTPPQSLQSSWRNLIKGVLDSQRGKIPLLLAVEAGNQSMCRELLSAQTTEQLTVRIRSIDF